MDEMQELARRLAETTHGRKVAAAESITAGRIATSLAAAPDASEWFWGSVVAYHTGMKRELLGVTSTMIISRDCATQMAQGLLDRTGADVVVATTGVGGPGPEEGRPAGTVVICAGTADDLRVFEHRFDGSPEQVVEQATVQALRHLAEAAR